MMGTAGAHTCMYVDATTPGIPRTFVLYFVINNLNLEMIR